MNDFLGAPPFPPNAGAPPFPPPGFGGGPPGGNFGPPPNQNGPPPGFNGFPPNMNGPPQQQQNFSGSDESNGQPAPPAMHPDRMRMVGGGR